MPLHDYRQYEQCESCHGEGKTLCTHCRGTGIDPKHSKFIGEEDAENCPMCDGSGKIECIQCDGLGGRYNDYDSIDYCDDFDGYNGFSPPTDEGKGNGASNLG